MPQRLTRQGVTDLNPPPSKSEPYEGRRGGDHNFRNFVYRWDAKVARKRQSRLLRTLGGGR